MPSPLNPPITKSYSLSEVREKGDGRRYLKRFFDLLCYSGVIIRSPVLRCYYPQNNRHTTGRDAEYL